MNKQMKKTIELPEELKSKINALKDKDIFNQFMYAVIIEAYKKGRECQSARIHPSDDEILIVAFTNTFRDLDDVVSEANKIRTNRIGYMNRHIFGLPKKTCIIRIIYKDVDGEHTYECDWKPHDPNDYGDLKPSKGYLGTAWRIDSGKPKIGFNVWEQNNSEFIYYRIVKRRE